MYLSVFFTFLFAAICAQVLSVQQCPESLNSCSCLEAYGKLFLTCKATSKEDLDQALEKFKGKELFKLSIIDSKLTCLPPVRLSNVKVSKIEIFNSTLFHLADDSLDGPIADSLIELKFDEVQFTEGLDLSILENMQKVNVISVTGSNLEQISAVMTTMEINVETLTFSDDNIEYISDEAFSTCKSLKNLILNQNFIKKFQRNILPLPTSEINLLDLRFNELSSLPNDAFDGMPKLNSVLLDRNKFKVLEKTYMSKVWNNLFYFSVANNPLVCDCKLSWLTEGSRKPFHLRGECQEPTALKGKHLKEIEKSDLGTCEA